MSKQKAMAEAVPDVKRPRVLVIDDDAGVRLVVRLNLEQHGYEVTVSDSGLDGLALAQAHPPDAIVLDLMMPVVDGFQVLNELRKDTRTKHVPVVILTAVPLPEAHEHVRTLGADDVMTKPFHADDLVRVVRDHVAGGTAAARSH